MKDYNHLCNTWDTYDPYFTFDKMPSFFYRSDIKFDTMPLEHLKNVGIHNDIFDEIISLLPEGAYIAGGFMRSILARENKFCGDIDIYFNSSKSFESMIGILQNLNSDGENFFNDYYCEKSLREIRLNSKSYRLINFLSKDKNKPSIQLIKLIWFESPQHVIDSFDFTIVQAATDGKNLYVNPVIWRDLTNKEIHLHKTQNPITTVNRLIKYEQKGYFASPEEFSIVANEAAAIVLSGKMDNAKEYFYLPRGNWPRQIPTSWLGQTWKFLSESENGRFIFAKFFGGKE